MFCTSRLDNSIERYEKVGETLVRLMLLYLPTSKARAKLKETVKRIKNELYSKRTLEIESNIIPKDDSSFISSINIDELIKTLRENMDNERSEKEIDDDVSSIESEQERNKEIIKVFKKPHKSKTRTKKPKKKREHKESKTPKTKLQSIRDVKPSHSEAKKVIRVEERRKSANVTTHLRDQEVMRIKKTGPRIRPIIKKESNSSIDPKIGKKCNLKAVDVLFQGAQFSKHFIIRNPSHSIPLELISRKYDLARIAKAKAKKPLKGLCLELNAYSDNTSALNKERVGTANPLVNNKKNVRTSLSTCLYGNSITKVVKKNKIVSIEGRLLSNK